MGHASILSAGGPAERLSSSRLLAVAIAAMIPIAAAAVAPPKLGLVMLGAAAAAAVISVVLIVAPGRAADVLLLMAIACMAIPIDKYFGYRDHVGGWPGYRLSAADLALLALLPLLALGRYLGRIHNRLPRALWIAYGLLLLQYCVSFVNAPRRDLAGLELLSAVHALATAAIVAAMFRRDLLKPALALIAFQVVLHSGFAVAQVVTGRAIGAGWFKGAEIVREALDTGVVELRPSGLFDHPIVFADVLTLTLPMLFAGLFVRGGYLWRLAMLGSLACGLVGLVLTLSRGAWIATLVAAVLLGLLAVRYRLTSWGRVRRIFLGALIAGIVVAAAFGPRIYGRLTESNAGNLEVRFELNWIALRMVEAHPLAGVGLSNFMPVMAQYDPKDVMSYFPATVHNLYLLEASEAGIPALLLFLAVFAAIFTSGLSGLRRMPDEGSRWVTVALIAGTAGFLVSQLADFSHRLEPLRSLLWMNIGLLFALQSRAAKDDRSESM